MPAIGVVVPDMQNLFISYRREDAADVAGRIYDRLCEQFGTDGIFMDVDKIPIGVDFRDHLDREVGRCQVLLVIIGRHWLDAGEEGARRLDDPADFVRIEIESALARGIPVVPLLVHGTEMPSPHELPESVRDLAYRNGIPVRADPDFRNDMDRLKAGLAHHLHGPPRPDAREAAKAIAEDATAEPRRPPVEHRPPVPPTGDTPATRRWRGPAALIFVVLLVAGGWLAFDAFSPGGRDASRSDRGAEEQARRDEEAQARERTEAAAQAEQAAEERARLEAEAQAQALAERAAMEQARRDEETQSRERAERALLEAEALARERAQELARAESAAVERARLEAEAQARALAEREAVAQRERLAAATEARRVEEARARRAEEERVRRAEEDRRLEAERARAEEQRRREAESQREVRLAVFPDESDQPCFHSVREYVEEAGAALDREFENVSLVYSFYAPGAPVPGLRDGYQVWTGESVRKHPDVGRVRDIARRLEADTVLMGWFQCSASANVSDFAYQVDLYLVDVRSGEVVRTRASAYGTADAARKLLAQLLARRRAGAG